MSKQHASKLCNPTFNSYERQWGNEIMMKLYVPYSDDKMVFPLILTIFCA
jgi:predicted peptidase